MQNRKIRNMSYLSCRSREVVNLYATKNAPKSIEQLSVPMVSRISVWFGVPFAAHGVKQFNFQLILHKMCSQIVVIGIWYRIQPLKPNAWKLYINALFKMNFYVVRLFLGSHSLTKLFTWERIAAMVQRYIFLSQFIFGCLKRW
jgi:hypothetical protein